MALSKDKSDILCLSTEGNVIAKPQDIIKQPTVMELLGIEDKAKSVESDLESAIIDRLQKFLLEGERLSV